jgi:hypothetical protein
MNLWSRIRSWVHVILRRSRMESEMDAELRFHIEAFAEDLVRSGASRQEAMRRWPHRRRDVCRSTGVARPRRAGRRLRTGKSGDAGRSHGSLAFRVGHSSQGPTVSKITSQAPAWGVEGLVVRPGSRRLRSCRIILAVRLYFDCLPAVVVWIYIKRLLPHVCCLAEAKGKSRKEKKRSGHSLTINRATPHRFPRCWPMPRVCAYG